MSISLAFVICSCAVGGGVEAGMPLCWVPLFGDKHCCGGNVWKGHSTVSEWVRLCFLYASSREAVIHRPSTAKQRPKQKTQIPFKMILIIFKHFLHLQSHITWILVLSVGKQAQNVFWLIKRKRNSISTTKLDSLRFIIQRAEV